jgi:hypothetical protein
LIVISSSKRQPRWAQLVLQISGDDMVLCRLEAHRRDVVATVLAAIGDAGHRPGDWATEYHWLVGSGRSNEKGLLDHRLRRQVRIDAGRGEEHQLVDADLSRGLDEVG